MAAQTFAAVSIGSAETEMRIYELSPRKGMRQIDCVNTRLGLGANAYLRGQLDSDLVEELCRVLREYRKIMQGYKVDDFVVCATSAIRELRSSLITCDYIEKQTGLKIQVLSNSEQRFLDYKSIACDNEFFSQMIASGAAIVDIGGNSMQISFFDKDRLITTQNIRMGKISTREVYERAARNRQHFEEIMRELMEHELNGFARLYQKERQIINLVVMDPDLQLLMSRTREMPGRYMDGARVPHIGREDFERMYETLAGMDAETAADRFDLTPDAAMLALQSLLYCRLLMDGTGASMLWLPDVSMCDGLCYDYGVEHKLLTQAHSFEDDIVAASRQIAKRYKSNQPHIKNIEEISLLIFDRMKKISGLEQRDRLLLRIATILHNCGKFISLTNVSECAYNIIMATEIIGLSHSERRIVANVVKFNTAEFEYYREMTAHDGISREEYLRVAKLTAILRLANALDRSHKQKCQDVSCVLRDGKLELSVRSQEDLTLERMTLEQRAPFFEEVFSVQPVLKQKKRIL